MTDTTFSTALAKAMDNFDKIDKIVQGDANTSVTTAGGDVPSIAKVIAHVNDKVFASISTTSQTGINIGTGSKTFEVEAGKAFKPNQYVVATSGSNAMYGVVTDYTDTNLTVNVQSVVGGGAASEWMITLSGVPGKSGRDGNDGLNGESLYEIAVRKGFLGTETDFLNSLKGPKGTDGQNGSNGERGKSAYEIAVEIGNFPGDETSWLASLKGPKGDKGTDGKSAFELAAAGGYNGTQADWIASLKGRDGTSIIIKDHLATSADLPANDGVGSAYVIGEDVWIKGENGWFDAGKFLGLSGADGKSAFEIAKDNGFPGTEQDWLLSLKGPKGDQGIEGKSAYQLALDNGFVGSITDWFLSLKGPKGDSGTGGGGGGGGTVAEVVIPDSSQITPQSINADDGNVFTVTVKNDFTLPPIQNPVSGQTYLFVLMQDQGGNHIITLDKKYKFGNNISPQLSTAGSAIDLLEATYSNTGFFFCNYHTGYTITQIARIGATRYDSMQLASNALQDGDTIYVTRSGQLSECTAWFGQAGTYTVAGDPAVNGVPELKVDSTIRLAFGKAILDPEAGNVIIRDLKLTGAVSSDHSGGGIRINPGVVHTRVERVTMSNNENGFITSIPSTANTPTTGYSIEIVDCVLDGNGTYNDGQSHNSYIQHKHRAYLLRTKYINCQHGHDCKTRAALTVLDRTYHRGSREGRELDVPNGGVVHAVNCSFIKDAGATQANLIGIGQEIPSDGANLPAEYIFRNCLFQNDQGGNFSETYIMQDNSNVSVKFVDCVFIGPTRCIMSTPFELYYTGGPIGPEGWDQSNRGVTPKRGTYSSTAGNSIWADNLQPVAVMGPDPTLDAFPPTGSSATPSVRPESLGPDLTAPSVSLTTSSTVVSNSGSITLSANATDNVGVVNVEFYKDGILIASDNSSPYTCVVALGVADNGTHTFTAKAYDLAGNRTESAPVTVTVNVLPAPTVYPFSMDDTTTTEYNTAIASADLGSKRLAGANAIAAAFQPYRLYIYQENTLVLPLVFTGTMVVADDGTNVTVSTGVPDPVDPLVAADITAGTWHFELQGGAGYTRAIKGSVGPTGSGKLIEISDNPEPGTGMQLSFTMTVPRSVDGLS
jgi:hypothetical protein